MNFMSKSNLFSFVSIALVSSFAFGQNAAMLKELSLAKGEYSLVEQKRGECPENILVRIDQTISNKKNLFGIYNAIPDMGFIKQFYVENLNTGKSEVTDRHILTGEPHTTIVSDSFFTSSEDQKTDPKVTEISDYTNIYPAYSKQLLTSYQSAMAFDPKTKVLSYWIQEARHNNAPFGRDIESFCIYRMK